MSAPTISIIVPVYNVENELARCVESILRQSYRDIEVILVDDGSTDSCPVICDEFARQDGRVHVLHQTNRGLSAARNTGLLAAKGEYILYVDSDDYIEADACSRLLQRSAEDVDIVAGLFYDQNGSKRKVIKRKGFRDGEVVSSREFIIRSVQNRCFMVQAWAYLYKKSFLLQNDLLFREGWLYEDLDLAPRLFMCAGKISFMDYPFYTHAFRRNSILCSPNSKKKIHDNLGIMKNWKETFDHIEDAELQKYLYYEMCSAYISMCRDRELRGWHIEGMNFPFVFKHMIGPRAKARAIKFEIKSILGI